MAIVDILKTQYMLYKLEGIPGDLDETVKVLDLFIDDMDEIIKLSRKKVKENFRDEYLTRVKNFFYGFLGYVEEDTEYFSYDTGIVLRHSCLADRYKAYFAGMKEAVSDENYVDMCKLAMFTYQNYSDNYQYLEMLRDCISYARDGITCYGPGEDTQGDFGEFFEVIFPVVKGRNKMYKK